MPPLLGQHDPRCHGEGAADGGQDADGVESRLRLKDDETYAEQACSTGNYDAPGQPFMENTAS